jgi:hypothetical protein
MATGTRLRKTENALNFKNILNNLNAKVKKTGGPYEN